MPLKGPIEFLEMAKRINQVNKDVHFFMAGSKWSEQFFYKIQKYIHNESLQECLTLNGAVYGEEKIALFRESDIFVFPSHDEAFPLVILEAMSAGFQLFVLIKAVSQKW